MKSEKVNEYLSKCIEVRKLTFCAADIEYTVELAEQEAEERMRQKSIKAFEDLLYMPAKQLAEECGVSIDRVCEDAGIGYCRQLFIQKLNEE